MKQHLKQLYFKLALLALSFVSVTIFDFTYLVKAEKTLPTNEPALSALDLKSDVKINAENGIEWDRKNSLYRASGHAHVTYETSTIDADTLTAHYRENDQGKTEIWLVQAEGNVIITSDQGNIKGDQVNFEVEPQILTITGNVHITNPDGQVFGDQGIYNHKTQLAEISGRVRIAQKNNFILGHRAEVDFKNGINRIEAGPNQQVRGLVIPKDLQRPAVNND